MKEIGFNHAVRERQLRDNQTVIGLKESEKLIGQLYPVLVDEKGNVLDGQHRLKSNPEWHKRVVKGVDSDRKRAMIRVHANWHRRKTDPTKVLEELAKITNWKGAAPYAAFLGCSVRTVQRYLPLPYKLRQRKPKRQLSLTEKKSMGPREIELRENLEKEEFQQAIELDREHLERGLNFTEKRKECLKLQKIRTFFSDMSENDILAYAENVNEKARGRVQHVAVQVLSNRVELAEMQQKVKLLRQKVEELYPKFKQVTVEFTDGSKLPLKVESLPYPSMGLYNGKNQIYPRDRGYQKFYVKNVILAAVVSDMLDFEQFSFTQRSVL